MMTENMFILKEVKNTNSRHKKSQEQSGTKANVHYITPFLVHDTGMSPYESDPLILLSMLDLATHDLSQYVIIM